MNVDPKEKKEAADIREILAFTKEELNGKLRPAEIVVDHSTLVETSKVHTSTLLLFNDKIEQLQSSVDEVRKTLCSRIDEVEAKVDKWGTRVEELERRADSHDREFARQEAINLEAEEFRKETNTALAETRQGIDNLVTALEELPRTIQIKTSQVHHASTADSDAEAMTEPLTGESVSLDILLDQHSACVTDHENRLDEHVERMDMMDEHTSNEIVRVMDWVTEQKQDELKEMNLLKDRVEKVEIDMSSKVSYYEVEEKIAVKVRELVDQIKEALLSVEEDEADFKNVANALHGLFNSLKESKADKSDMALLREQMIKAQLNSGPTGSSDDGTLDYKSLRKILSSYPKTEVMEKKLEEKAGKDFTFQRLEHTEDMVEKILRTIDELWSVFNITQMTNSQNTYSPSSTELEVPSNVSSIATKEMPELVTGTLSSISEVDVKSNCRPSYNFALSKENKAKSFQRIDYTFHRPSTTTNPPRDSMQHLARGIRPNTTGAAFANKHDETKHRPHTSPVGSPHRLSSMSRQSLRSTSFGRPYRKSVVPNSRRHLPAIETKQFISDEDRHLFVANSQATSIIRDSTELSSRKMSFRDGKATST